MTYEIRDDGGATKIIEAPSIEEALEEAQEWASEGCYDERVMVGIWVEELDANGERTGAQLHREVEAGPLPQPAETECGTEDVDHTWASPYELVGGVRENPGVWSTGGTSFRYEWVCAKCGTYKTVYETGTQRNPGELPETTEYRAPDAKSLTWVAELQRKRDEEVREFIGSYEDDDEIDEAELERVFRLAYGRRADDEDRETGLWSLICASVAGWRGGEPNHD
jgi:hypothetical protein